MKIVNSLLTFVSLCAIFGSCVTPPDISIIPEIHFSDIALYQRAGGPDSLVVSVTFRDGDGDLGLDPESDYFTSDPYNRRFYYIDNNGTLDSIPTEVAYPGLPSLLKIPEELKCAKCKIVTAATKRKSAYQNNNKLPYYEPEHCYEYTYTTVYVSEPFKSIAESTIPKLDTAFFNGLNVYALLDTFYYKLNPNHNNFDVEILTEQPNNPDRDSEGYALFDWSKNISCYEDLNGRFPYLTGSSGAVEGTLSYGIVNNGLLKNFKNKKIKLRVRIRDRALHHSNTIVTSEAFYLTQKIRL